MASAPAATVSTAVEQQLAWLVGRGVERSVGSALLEKKQFGSVDELSLMSAAGLEELGVADEPGRAALLAAIAGPKAGPKKPKKKRSKKKKASGEGEGGTGSAARRASGSGGGGGGGGGGSGSTAAAASPAAPPDPVVLADLQRRSREVDQLYTVAQACLQKHELNESLERHNNVMRAAEQVVEEFDPEVSTQAIIPTSAGFHGVFLTGSG